MKHTATRTAFLFFLLALVHAACADIVGITEKTPYQGGGGATSTSSGMGASGASTSTGGTGGIGGTGGSGGGRVECNTDEDCVGSVGGPKCDPDSHVCVMCIPSEDACQFGLYCNPDTEICDVGCVAHGDCNSDGTDGPLTCDPTSNLCEGCQNGAACPPGTVCVGNVCEPGCADILDCPMGWDCCTGQCANVAEDNQHCGACDNACSPENGTGDCQSGSCKVVTCETGYGNCDLSDSTGCETDLDVDPLHCGSCDDPCDPLHATGSCVGGQCLIMECESGHGDCNGQASDGCETSLLDDFQHCGDCATVCNLPGAMNQCTGGQCSFKDCLPGFTDCTGSPGCETATNTDPNNCGDCGILCDLPHVATNTCAGGTCGIGMCDPKFGNCDMVAGNGCETSLATDKDNCNGCGIVCPGGNQAICIDGVCGMSTLMCNDPLADCNGIAGDGCEVNTDTSPSHCGGCGAACQLPHVAVHTCSGGTCGVGTCAPGWGDCDGSPGNGCETPTTADAENCGGCGTVCTFANATAQCLNSMCALGTCDPGHGNCDLVASNGCEADILNDPAHCGGSCIQCNLNHAVEGCSNGICSIDACDPGFGDCDGLANNGCETNTQSSAANCGSCGVQCMAANGTSTCNSGQCFITSCTPPFADCDGVYANGCESNLQIDEDHCGSCVTPCAPGLTCVAGVCIGCSPPFEDCGNNGTCENTQVDPTNCGSCEVICPPMQTCSNGTCTNMGCMPPTQDCDSNGTCEDLNNDPNNCGTCGNVCGAGQQCLLGTCSCMFPFADCGADGTCEDLFSDPNNCGGCGIPCKTPLPHSLGAMCTMGMCSLDCQDGYSNCDGYGPNGCECLGTCSAGMCIPDAPDGGAGGAGGGSTSSSSSSSSTGSGAGGGLACPGYYPGNLGCGPGLFCGAGEACCQPSEAGAPSCLPDSCVTCPGRTSKCDQKIDCQLNEVCCAFPQPQFEGGHCTTACQIMERRLCVSGTDCNAGEKCCPPSTGPGAFDALHGHCRLNAEVCP